MLLEGEYLPLALDPGGSNETLDLGGLGAGLLSVLLGKGSVDNVLSDIVLLGQVEKLPDLSDPLGSQSARCGGVGESWDLLFSLADNNQIQNTEMGYC